MNKEKIVVSQNISYSGFFGFFLFPVLPANNKGTGTESMNASVCSTKEFDRRPYFQLKLGKFRRKLFFVKPSPLELIW